MARVCSGSITHHVPYERNRLQMLRGPGAEKERDMCAVLEYMFTFTEGEAGREKGRGGRGRGKGRGGGARGEGEGGKGGITQVAK